jgi:hypothetical protein
MRNAKYYAYLEACWRMKSSPKGSRVLNGEEGSAICITGPSSRSVNSTNHEQVLAGERVEKIMINIQDGRVQLTFEKAFQEVSIKRRNAVTPTSQGSALVPEGSARKVPDGRLAILPWLGESLTHHDRICKELADLGSRMRFIVHADIEGYRKSSFPFKVYDATRVSRIDVIWYDESRAIATYEVETSTRISEAIIRGSNIDDMDTIRVLVIPEERNSFLKRKLMEPILREQIGRYRWRAIIYEDLYNFLNKRRKRDPRFEDLQPLMVNLRNSKPQIQQSIQEYFPHQKPD